MWLVRVIFQCYNFIVSGLWDNTARVWKGVKEEKLVKFAGKTF